MCFCGSFCLLRFHLCPDAPPNFHCVVTRATIRRKRESHIFLFDKSTYVVFQWWSYLIYQTAGVQTVFPEFLVCLTLYKILCRFRLWSRQGCLKKNIWQVLSSFRKRALHPFCFLSCLCRHCSYGLASSGQVCEWTQVLFQWYLYSSRYVWYGRVCCVNTKMGRTPTDSGGLRLVIMHNHKNEEEGKIWRRKLEVKYSKVGYL